MLRVPAAQESLFLILFVPYPSAAIEQVLDRKIGKGEPDMLMAGREDWDITGVGRVEASALDVIVLVLHPTVPVIASLETLQGSAIGIVQRVAAKKGIGTIMRARADELVMLVRGHGGIGIRGIFASVRHNTPRLNFSMTGREG